MTTKNETRTDARPTVVLVDDHKLVRDAIAGMLERSNVVRVIGRLDRAEEAIELVQNSRPSLVLMDVEMPGRSAFDVARTLRGLSPTTKIAFLTAHEHPSFAAEAERIGAIAFLHKSSSLEKVVSAIERILLGHVVFESKPSPSGSLVSSLSPREHEVLTYIGRGLNTKEMAVTMCLSPRTVERHVERLMQRLGVHERVKLALLAHREGLVSGASPEQSNA
jgi:two-component system, NarL family, invasion response regulator UvrY